jgi:hypothetical protein
MILAHNHPSGVAEPSRADELLTQSLKQALALVDVRVLDHFIVAGRYAVCGTRPTLSKGFPPFASEVRCASLRAVNGAPAARDPDLARSTPDLARCSWLPRHATIGRCR